jgi:hypothetical protein
MAVTQASANCKSAELSVVVIRANGDREDLGVVARYDRNPIKQMINKIKQLFKTFNKGNQ